MSGFMQWVKDLLASEKQQWPPADRSDVRPKNCPICNCKIEQKQGSDSYVCVGLKDREEIEQHFGLTGVPLPPPSVTEIGPCGWHALADDFGKTWE